MKRRMEVRLGPVSQLHRTPLDYQYRVSISCLGRIWSVVTCPESQESHRHVFGLAILPKGEISTSRLRTVVQNRWQKDYAGQ